MEYEPSVIDYCVMVLVIVAVLFWFVLVLVMFGLVEVWEWLRNA